MENKAQKSAAFEVAHCYVPSILELANDKGYAEKLIVNRQGHVTKFVVKLDAEGMFVSDLFQVMMQKK